MKIILPSLFFFIIIQGLVTKTHATQLEDSHHENIKFLRKEVPKKKEKKKQKGSYNIVPFKHLALFFDICPASKIVNTNIKIITYVRKMRFTIS